MNIFASSPDRQEDTTACCSLLASTQGSHREHAQTCFPAGSLHRKSTHEEGSDGFPDCLYCQEKKTVCTAVSVQRNRNNAGFWIQRGREGRAVQKEEGISLL